MLRPHSPTVRVGPTPYTGWAHLQGGQRSVSLEYQTCTSAYLFDTLVTGKANPTKKLRQELADFGPNIFLSAIEWSGKFARISLRLRGHQEGRTRGGRNI